MDIVIKTGIFSASCIPSLYFIYSSLNNFKKFKKEDKVYSSIDNFTISEMCTVTKQERYRQVPETFYFGIGTIAGVGIPITDLVDIRASTLYTYNGNKAIWNVQKDISKWIMVSREYNPDGYTIQFESDTFVFKDDKSIIGFAPSKNLLKQQFLSDSKLYKAKCAMWGILPVPWFGLIGSFIYYA